MEKRKIVGLIEKRREKEIIEYLESWGEEILFQIKEVSIDLWKSYKNIVEKLMPQAEIVADRFHVMKQVTDELDAARRKIKRETETIKSQSKKETILEGLKKRMRLYSEETSEYRRTKQKSIWL